MWTLEAVLVLLLAKLERLLVGVFERQATPLEATKQERLEPEALKVLPPAKLMVRLLARMPGKQLAM